MFGACARKFALALVATVLVLPALAQAGDAWRHMTREQGLPSDEIQFIKSENGTIWVGTLGGLARIENGKPVTVRHEGEYWDILDVGRDAWCVGTAGGVLFMRDGKATASLAGNTVAPLLRRGQTIWALAKNRSTERNAVVVWDGRAWAPVESLKDRMPVDLFQTRDAAIWVALDGDGVLVVPPGDPVKPGPHHLQGYNISAMCEDMKGRVWCGTRNRGIFVLADGAWTRHLEKEKSIILGVREDARGRIWATTNDHGLWRFEAGKWVNDLAGEGAINMLEPTSDGRVWISSQTTGGLRYWRDGRWQVSLESPLPIRCLVEIKGKGIWAGGVLDGVYVLPP